MYEFTYWSTVAIVWVIAGYALVDLLRHRRTYLRIATWIQLVSISVALLVLADAVRLNVDRITNVPSFGQWLSFSLILVSACAFWIKVAVLTRPTGTPRPRIRARIAVTVAAVTAMGILLLGAGLPDDTNFTFIITYGDRPRVVGFYLIFLGYVTVMVIDTLRLAWRYIGQPRQPYLRLGMRLLMLGDIAGLVYVVYQGSDVLARYWSLPRPPGGAGTVSEPIGLIAVALINAGPTISGWGPRLAAPGRALAQRWALLRLRPLWRALTTQMPQLRQQQPALDNVGYRLYRRIIEIHDGLVVLEPYQDPHLADEAASTVWREGLSGAAATAAVQARVIAAALRARSAMAARSGLDPVRTRPANKESGRTDPGTTFTGDTSPLKAEVADLTRLSHAFAHLRKGA